MKIILERFPKVLPIALLTWILTGASSEFYQIAWGTGTLLGGFSRTWAILFFIFCFTSLVILAVYLTYELAPNRLAPVENRVILLRAKLRWLRWILWGAILVAPVLFFQYTPWGIAFQKPYLRIVAWAGVVLLLAALASKDRFAGWREFLAALVFTAGLFSIAASLKEVSDYPFSLGWSEGNRLWDYSILFGRSLYNYPADKEIPVFLDFGRQFVGGLPFLFPGVNIVIERLWVGLTQVIPYFILGVAAFRGGVQKKTPTIALVVWSFLFVKQGPIHPPLLLCAALVALAWRSSYWYSIPLMILSGYFAQTSRYTWAYAPAIWIVMLEFASASFTDPKAARAAWKRSVILGLCGLLGAFFFTQVVSSLMSASPLETSVPEVEQQVLEDPASVVPPTESETSSSYIQFLINEIKNQPLLWYRLLPNSTYGMGILFALFIAVVPLSVVLIYLIRKQLWTLTRLQKLSLILPLFAFLIVGLVISTKIGGGGDLHNMDMFLIGLFFSGVVAWRAMGLEWLFQEKLYPVFIKVMFSVMIIASSVIPLLEMRSYDFGEDIPWLLVLTDAPEESVLEMLPPHNKVDAALQAIQEEVTKAEAEGEVLFVDQRQLLTFGYITGVELVPEYDKKMLMDRALSSSADYFEPFYNDLKEKRFSLIISEPLHSPIQDSSYHFGEENNAWVKWVSIPVLCYYEPLKIKDLTGIRVQLLVPKTEVVDCSAVLPFAQ